MIDLKAFGLWVWNERFVCRGKKGNIALALTCLKLSILVYVQLLFFFFNFNFLAWNVVLTDSLAFSSNLAAFDFLTLTFPLRWFYLLCYLVVNYSVPSSHVFSQPSGTLSRTMLRGMVIWKSLQSTRQRCHKDSSFSEESWPFTVQGGGILNRNCKVDCLRLIPFSLCLAKDISVVTTKYFVWFNNPCFAVSFAKICKTFLKYVLNEIIKRSIN